MVKSVLSLFTRYENLSDDLIIVGQPISEVEIHVEGRRSSLRTFLEEEHACVFDLSNISAGLTTLSINESNIVPPSGVSILRINPTSITLRVEARQTKTVPVDITLIDSPAAGYRVSLARVTPSTIFIRGPEKNIESIDQLATQPISLKDVSESFKTEIALDLPEDVTVGGHTASDTPLVVVEVNIEENIIVRRFTAIVVEGRNAVYPVRITPPVVDIDVRGPENRLDQLSADDDIRAFVDLSGLAPGVYARRAQIDNLPVGTTLAGAKPEVFSVTVGP